MLIKTIVYLYRLVVFILYYIKELTLSNVRIAKEVLSPEFKISPKIITFDLSVTSPWQKFTVANLVTMTPGTISTELINNDKTLAIHAMYGDEEIAIKESLRSDLEPKIRNLIP